MLISAENYVNQYLYYVSATFQNLYLYPIDAWC
jgi:hypothetical protein